MKRLSYASAVASLIYAMVCTRPDIAHAVSVVSRVQSWQRALECNEIDYQARFSLCFGNGKTMLDGYTDADIAGDLDNRKSTSGYLMTFAGRAVSWQRKLHQSIALSSTEAESIATTEACKESLWLLKFLQELGMKQERYLLHCAIHLCKNSTFHSLFHSSYYSRNPNCA